MLTLLEFFATGFLQRVVYKVTLRQFSCELKQPPPPETWSFSDLGVYLAGVSWKDMHLLAERVVLSALKDMGLVVGDVEEMVQNRIGALFMPHGLGHFMGVDVHDVHGYPPGGPARPEGRVIMIIHERY